MLIGPEDQVQEGQGRVAAALPAAHGGIGAVPKHHPALGQPVPLGHPPHPLPRQVDGRRGGRLQGGARPAQGRLRQGRRTVDVDIAADVEIEGRRSPEPGQLGEKVGAGHPAQLRRVAVRRQPVGFTRAHDLETAPLGEGGPIGVHRLDAAAQGLLLLLHPGLRKDPPLQVRLAQRLTQQLEAGGQQVGAAGEVRAFHGLVVQVQNLEGPHAFGLGGEEGPIEVVGVAVQLPKPREAGGAALQQAPHQGHPRRRHGPEQTRKEEIDPHRLEAARRAHVEAQPGAQEEAVEVRVALRGHGESGGWCVVGGRVRGGPWVGLAGFGLRVQDRRTPLPGQSAGPRRAPVRSPGLARRLRVSDDGASCLQDQG